jgi:hypothetical protein
VKELCGQRLFVSFYEDGPDAGFGSDSAMLGYGCDMPGEHAAWHHQIIEVPSGWRGIAWQTYPRLDVPADNTGMPTTASKAARRRAVRGRRGPC